MWNRMDFILYSRKEEIVFNIKMGIDFILPKVLVIFASIWFIQSLYAIIISGPFSVIHLLLVNLPMHVTTGLNLTAVYLVNHFFFRTFMPGHERVTRAVLFTMAGVFFYDFVWSASSILINGYGSFLLPLTSFLAVLGFMYIVNKKSFIINLNWKYIILAGMIYLISLVVFINSGFFQQFALWEQGLATDPHSWEWLFNKTASLWMWMAIANK